MLIRTYLDLAAVIRERRRQRGLDQAELAYRIGVSRQWIVAVEKGKSRAEVGLVLRALDELGLRLETRPQEDVKPLRGSPDINAVVEAHKRR